MDHKTMQLFRRLHASITLQVEQLKEMSRTLGGLEMISNLAAAASSPIPSDEETQNPSDPSQDGEDINFHEILEVNQMV